MLRRPSMKSARKSARKVVADDSLSPISGSFMPPTSPSRRSWRKPRKPSTPSMISSRLSIALNWLKSNDRISGGT